MFDVQNVFLSYGAREILRDASFKVEDGERAAIIGPNGTGKSTLLKIVAGILKPEKGVVSFPKTTEIGYLPQDMELNTDNSVLEECRTIFQDLLDHEQEMRNLEDKMSHVPHGTPEFDKIADRYEYLLHETQRRDLYSMDSTIGKILDGLGFKVSEFEKPCRSFSGGWQMRIGLAKILLQNPDILLLDEPTNHLDIEAIEWLAEWLQGHHGSVLMVSHERSFMDALVKKVVEIDRANAIVYRGNYSESLQKRAERREMQRRTYENQQKEIAHIQTFIDRFRYQAAKAALVQSRIKQLERIERVEAPLEDQGTISFRFPSAPRSGKEVVMAENIYKAYGEKVVLNGVSVAVYRGEKVAFVGHNGAGKSTLMRIVAGRDTNHKGTVTVGSNVERAYFAQYDVEDLHPDNDVLGEFLSNAPLSVSNKSRDILGAFLFSGDDVEKKIKMLSGGERTRLRLAKMLCGNANLLLLDEPTNHLDIGSRLTLEEALRQYDGAVILVSHDRYFLDSVVTRVVEIENGEAKSYPGNYSDYLSMKAMQEAAANGAATTPARSKVADEPAPTPRVDAEALKAQLATVPTRESAEDRRDRQQPEKNARNRLRKVEKEIEEYEDELYRAEEAIRLIENEMAKTAADFNKLQDLTARLEKTQTHKAAIEARWLALQEEKDKLVAEVG